jgi:hypothetical protein
MYHGGSKSPTRSKTPQRMLRKHQQARQHPIRLMSDKSSTEPYISRNAGQEHVRLDGMGERSTVRGNVAIRILLRA